MRILATLAVLSIAALAGCLQGDVPEDNPATPSEPATPYRARFPPPNLDALLNASAEAVAPGVRFILTGDTGTGSETQYKVGRTIDAVCAAHGCDFMAILGDVIYESGVSSPNDPQFEEKFELPYANLTVPIYTVLGNHDNSWDPTLDTPVGQDLGAGHWYEAGTHMVDYHYRTDRMSEKWQLPDRYYSFRYGDAEFFALDSNTMMYQNIPFGSTRQEAYEDALGQAAWFDEVVAASNATWKFTLAHHPYVSNGEHGDAGSYDDHNLQENGIPVPLAAPGVRGDGVKMFFDDHVCASGQIDLHLAGHDHDLQWLKPVESCGATEFIVSGAGAKTRALMDPTDDAWFGAGGIPGFFWVELVGDTFHAIVFDEDGTVLYERSLVKAA